MTTPETLVGVLNASSVMITWSVNQLGTLPMVNGLTDAVVTVGWQIKGQQLKTVGSTDSYIAELSGTISVSPVADKFTPYNQLTQEQIVYWINQQLGHTKTQGLIKQIIANIEKQKNPIVNRALPW
jgi:hypothetical protein